MSVGTIVGALLVAAMLRQPASTLPPADALALRLNPNTASVTELMLLPGIGPKIAEHIIQHRTGPASPYRSTADLDAVPRIGPATIQRLAPHLRFDSPSQPPAATVP